MKDEEKSAIYDRLLQLSVELDIKSIPNPQYMYQKIGLCHVYTEEVEKFFIQCSKEKSVIQRALNNALAGYEQKKDSLITNDPEVSSLPSLKDREAKANVMLHKELADIKSYQNDLSDLDNLIRAINLKLKNLGRLNSDIKAQVRILESQVKMGTPAQDNPALRSFMEEMNKSAFGADVFENAETSAEETKTEDPSAPLDVDDLLKEKKEILGDDMSMEDLLSEYEESSPEEKSENKSDESEPEQSSEPEPETEEDDEKVVDLDQVLEPDKPKTGGEPEICEPEAKTVEESTQKETQVEEAKNPDKINIDDLLSQFK